MNKICIVTTLYKSQNFIAEFYSQMLVSLKEANIQNYEFIFVDDGSPDESNEEVLKLIEKDNQVTLIKLTKNYGHHNAMLCGLSNAKADYTFLIDCDLEEKPSLFLEFYKKIQTEKLDLIYGVQSNRNKDNFLGVLFWNILVKFTGINLAKNPCTVRIMSNKFIQRLTSMQQKEFFLGELSQHVGLKQDTIQVTKSYKGSSTYSFWKKINVFVDIIFSNSSQFWIKLSFLSALISFVSALALFLLVVSFALGKQYLSGWLSIMCGIALFSSFNFFFLAVLLQMTSKILLETRAKPNYIIDEIIQYK
jgi:putative glycosyltransferase